MVAGLIPARRKRGDAAAILTRQLLDEMAGAFTGEDPFTPRQVLWIPASLVDVVMVIPKGLTRRAVGGYRAVGFVELPVGELIEALKHPLRKRRVQCLPNHDQLAGSQPLADALDSFPVRHLGVEIRLERAENVE